MKTIEAVRQDLAAKLNDPHVCEREFEVFCQRHGARLPTSAEIWKASWQQSRKVLTKILAEADMVIWKNPTRGEEPR